MSDVPQHLQVLVTDMIHKDPMERPLTSEVLETLTGRKVQKAEIVGRRKSLAKKTLKTPKKQPSTTKVTTETLTGSKRKEEKTSMKRSLTSEEEIAERRELMVKKEIETPKKQPSTTKAPTETLTGSKRKEKEKEIVGKEEKNVKEKNQRWNSV